MSRIVPFDYSAIPANLKSEAQSIIAEYRESEQQSRAEYQEVEGRVIERGAAIGRRLLAIRDQIERGLFLKWLKAEFPASQSTAYRMMDLAERLGHELPTVGRLPPRVVYKLAEKTTPEPVRVTIIDSLRAGEQLTPEKIVETVEAAREADRLAKVEAKLTDEQKRKRAQNEKRQRRTAEQRRAEHEERSRQREAEDQAEARSAAAVMDVLSSRFSDDELRRLGALFYGHGTWLPEVLRGEHRSWLRSGALNKVLALWAKRLAREHGGAA